MTLASVEVARRRFIGGRGNPLVVRYIVFRTPWGSLFVHKLCRSDYERALHDHPWPFVSLVLAGSYFEVSEDRPRSHGSVQYASGPLWVTHRPWLSVAYRPATWKHRVVALKPCWTLVFVGPRQRNWGFWVDGKWCWWRRHNPELNICEDRILYEGGND
jgi:hypothetical protein